MSREMIEKMAKIGCVGMHEGDCENCNKMGFCSSLSVSKRLYNAGYRKQSEGELRVETITDDFTDMELAKERGWYRKRFYCPNCDLLIKTETWDRKYMFGCGTVLKSNDMPTYCPNCGAKMTKGDKE